MILQNCSFEHIATKSTMLQYRELFCCLGSTCLIMHQLGEQYITILVKICQFMRNFSAKPHEKSHEKTLFLPLLDLKNTRCAKPWNYGGI